MWLRCRGCNCDVQQVVVVLHWRIGVQRGRRLGSREPLTCLTEQRQEYAETEKRFVMRQQLQDGRGFGSSM